ncbi:23S rRNA (guanosine(2251)-2'-O)-methyltransferase RlmB [Mesonia sp. HuA40]|uniref:23S rRNA (guanosine(2251)-2'-O)-methyltransferase RlmB n=1 Tax=Mesonia sp. HuA40 TaxID=2602761 RepID=UPI0011C7EB3E|nr:23S rRNA (guanosine(2251)-2'-O)-methyltransferase RlmB [Mesonia sp. HuA40]TXK75335.1 23S rRNA (guanosine(2251)-2'-O)-methyltransferase RlmB [Mesonia sp. HuA40]
MSTIIFGIHAVHEAIKSNQTLDKIFVDAAVQSSGIKEILKLAENASVQIAYVPHQKIDKLAKNGNHQGIVAKISPIQFHSLEAILEENQKTEKSKLYLILDGVSDVRNFGAIIRTAESVGVDAIIFPKQGSASINEQMVKTSTGAIFNIPLCKVDHTKDALFYLKSYGIKTIAATEKASKMVYDVNFRDSIAIIMGSEGKGVSKAALKMSDDKVKLPIFGETSSLNVSVACGAILYEVVRQRL